jgi:septum formation protein
VTPTESRLVLATASPRRRALLTQLGLTFEAVATHADETIRPGANPEQAVLDVAGRKLDAYLRAASAAPAFVLAVDTEVVLGERLFGKPSDPKDARRMLQDLSGRTHRVVTAVVLQDPSRRRSNHLETSHVTISALTPVQIDAYVATGEPFDKAGGYAVQGQGAAFIEKVEGDYTNVVGLPLRPTLRLLAKAGFPLPPHLRL